MAVSPHGGKRKGAGRKKEADRYLTVKLREDQVTFLEAEAKKRGDEDGRLWSLAKVIREIIDTFVTNQEKERN